MSSQKRKIKRIMAKRQLALEGVPHPCRSLHQNIQPYFRTEWKKAAGRLQTELANGRTKLRVSRQNAKRSKASGP